MARPSKSTAVLNDEKKSHRTKAEIEQREAAERAALTGLPLRESKEVRKDKIAHKEFTRVKELLGVVGKDDALFESVINDYCRLKSDIARYIDMRKSMEQDLKELVQADVDPETRYKLKNGIYKNIEGCDRQIQAFQKKRFDIEKENGFTIASAMRSIPKAPKTKENPLMEPLQNGGS